MKREVNIHYVFRTIRDLKEKKTLDFKDPEGILNYLNENVKRTFLANPSIISDNSVCQIIALDGETVVGTELCFPNRYLDGVEQKSCFGHSTLFVSEPYRKLMVGTDLMMLAASFVENQDNIVAGISQMAYPIYKAMRYGCFSFPRFILLIKSRCVVEAKLHSDGFVSKCVSNAIDMFLKLHKTLICSMVSTGHLVVETVKTTPKEVEDIVKEDDHRFKELHDRKWFDWNIAYSFKPASADTKYLNVVKQRGVIVAFYLVKIEYFSEAGSCGYKNIRLATVVEWGIKKGCSFTEAQLHMIAIKNIKEDVDGIQIATTDKETELKYRKIGFFPMGIVNNAVYMSSIKDKEVKKQENWRIRIAAGDTLID